MELNKLRDEAYQIAIEHGWHDEEYSDEHLLMLVVCELAEAVEADRSNIRADRKAYEHDMMNALCEKHLSGEDLRIYECSTFNNYIKDSIQDELSDVAIRCLDLAGLRGIDLPVSLNPTQSTLERTKELTFTEWSYRISRITVDDFLATESKITLILLNILAKSELMGFDLFWHVEHKMKFNKSRAYKHGKNY